MGKIKQQLMIAFEMDDDNEIDITYQLDPKTDEVPQDGRTWDLHVLAITCCDAAYKAMREAFK